MFIFKINKKKKYKNVIFLMIIIFFIASIVLLRPTRGAMNPDQFFTWNQKKYFIIYSNIRNYDAYGFAFKENGKSPEKIFLGKGMVDRGYIMSHGEDILISNPSQNNAYIINKKGFIHNVNFDENLILSNLQNKYFVAYYPYIIVFSNDENLEIDNKNSNILLKPHEILLKKNMSEDIKLFKINCQWINYVFAEKDFLYVILKKNTLQKKYTIEKYNINSGEKIKENLLHMEDNAIPNPKEISIANNIMALKYNNDKKNHSKNIIIFYNLKEMKLIKKLFLPNNFIFNRIHYNGKNFCISGNIKDKYRHSIAKYLIFDNNSFEITKDIDMNLNIGIYSEKKECNLKDILEDKKYLYAFYQTYELKKINNNNFFNEIMIFVWSILGIYEGPSNESIVCIFDKKTGLQIEKIVFKINDERLKNGIMIPFLLNNKKELK